VPSDIRPIRRAAILLFGAILVFGVRPAAAENAPGITDREIRIGQTAPYSGPASALSAAAKTEAAYFRRVNETGGVGGRKITLISLDDGYSPPKTVEQTRRLVESDQVALIFGTVGAPTNAATYKYLNRLKVPQILLSTGASRFNDPVQAPWSTTLQPTFRMEGAIYAQYLREARPQAKVAILYQYDDFGKDFSAGFKDALGPAAATMVVGETSYDVSDATVDSEIITLQATGADVFLNLATPKFAAQAIRKAFDIGWKPLQFIPSPGASIGATLKPAGLDRSVGIVSALVYKPPGDPRWAADPEMQEYLAFMAKDVADVDPSDVSAVSGYYSAAMLVSLLAACGDDLSRENIMKHATSIPDMRLPLLLPGVTVHNTPKDYQAFHRLQLERFNGTSWELFGGLMGEP
jgi:ABC-type branched-subunit amino acid transport system substrate-binding protein